MKLVLFHDPVYGQATCDPGVVGGAERQQWLLARALAACGWSVAVGVQKGLEPGRRVTIAGVEFVGVERSGMFSPPCQRLLSLYRFLRSELPDWWYWRCADHLFGPAVEIAKTVGVKTIFSAAFDDDVQPHRALSRRRRLWPLFAWGLSRADRIFVQHGGQFWQLPRQWRSKAYIVPSVVAYPNGIKVHSEREQYVAWVGMLRQPKRPDLLIEIVQQAPRLRFVVCGGPTVHRSPPGYGEQVLRTLRALPNVDYRGQVAPDIARQVIANAAAYLLTSDKEGFPNTLLEAYSSGTPVVTLKIDPDRIINRFGLGVISGSTRQAVAELNNLMESCQKRNEICLRARNYVADAHSEKSVVNAFEKAIGIAGYARTEPIRSRSENLLA